VELKKDLRFFQKHKEKKFSGTESWPVNPANKRAVGGKAGGIFQPQKQWSMFFQTFKKMGKRFKKRRGRVFHLQQRSRP